MQISMAVKDYMKMFPEEYNSVLKAIKIQKNSLKTELAEIKGSHGITRALYTIPEKLHEMISTKLNNEEDELAKFKELDSARWFATKFPMFNITKKV